MNRRTIMAGVAAGALATGALAAGVWRFTDLLVKHHPPTPYDDLLDRLVDRDAARIIGKAGGGRVDVPHTAARLRARLKGKTLADAVNADIAAGRITEVSGWLLPESLALLAVVAAKA